MVLAVNALTICLLVLAVCLLLQANALAALYLFGPKGKVREWLREREYQRARSGDRPADLVKMHRTGY